MGELKCTVASGGTPSDTPTSTASEVTAEAPVEASGSTQGMPPLEEDMEVGNVNSPIRTAEDKLLDESSDQADSQAQEVGDTPRETSEEADPNTTPTGGETPSTGVTAGLSELSVSLPRPNPLQSQRRAHYLHSSRSCQRHRPTRGGVGRSRLDHTRRL